MSKNAMVFSLVLFSKGVFASGIDLYGAPLTSLQLFTKSSSATPSRNVAQQANVLQVLSSTQDGMISMVRYQQLYHGIPVVGSQVIITKSLSQGRSVSGTEAVSGHLSTVQSLNTKPKLNSQQVLAIAKQDYFSHSQANIQSESVVLQIREGQNSYVLNYLISFKSIDAQDNPVWPFYIIDAQTGAILQQWDNIQHYADFGPGGNVKTKKYIYGKNGLPPLQVIKEGAVCTMDSPAVKLTHLRFKWDYYDAILSPYKYLCGKNAGDPIHDAYSPANDAYYFGQVVFDMYLKWYGLPVLRGSRGKIGKLLMRVHFGLQYDNAFWDGTSMTFGDGLQFYPLVSLDVAGHEVTHGFTQQHAGLEYHDQSGALNEAMSDMGGQTTKAYLLATSPSLYKKVYLENTSLTWGIGETIIPSSMGTALRFMNNPSADGSSADCFSKSLATSSGGSCLRTYAEVVAAARADSGDPSQQQSYIVHKASGVFNKAFYLLSQQVGVKVAYKIMLRANMKYWTPTTNFTSGACGVLHATQDYKLNTNMVRTVFNQVGVSTSSCKL